MKRKILLLISAMIAFNGVAATIYVDNIKGNNGNDGSREKPVACIQYALGLMSISDCMEVINTGRPYQRPYPGEHGQALYIRNGGTLENPMIINGNGAVITGLTIIPPDKWKQTDEGFYALPFWPMSNMYKSYKQQNYWLDGTRIWWIDGKAAVNCKSLDELKSTASGFWWNKEQKTVLYHLPQGKKLDELKIEIPGNSGFYILADHTIVKDFYVTHSWNDGFDAAEKNQNSVFKNCIAIDNCGQGFSSHGNSNIYYEDCAAIRCASSGVCDVHWSNTRFSRCIFMNNTFETGIFALEESSHIYSDCLIIGNEPFEQIWQYNTSNMIFENCVIIGTKTKDILTLQNGNVSFKNCSITGGSGLVNYSGKTNSFLALDNCLIYDMPNYVLKLSANSQLARIRMTGNLFAVSPGIIVEGKNYNEANWDEFCKLYPKNNSEWLPNTAEIADYSINRKMISRHGGKLQVGARLPNTVWDMYKKLKKIKATPNGITNKDIHDL